MRAVRVEDAWRRVKNLENYSLRIRQVSIKESDRYINDFELSFSSGLNVICGRNGVGKSNILRKIYDLAKGNITCGEVVLEHFNKKKKIIVQKTSGNEAIYYIEPSIECSKIISYLKLTSNSEELMDGVDPNSFFSSRKNIGLMKQIVGKPYRNIFVYEIEGAIYDDYTFPFIKVEMENGLTYTCTEMGMGEFLCFYIVWFLQWAENGSIVLIEELENFLSAYSQNHLINHLAETSSSRGLWALVTSHSDYILNKFDSQSLFLISQCAKGRTKFITYTSEKQYKDALGITLIKNSSILFEDHFAKLFGKLILSRLKDSTLYFSDLFYVTGGESDLEKIAAHFQPVGQLRHKITCVFDADQSKKVVTSNSKVVPVLALPSSSLLNPEDELWSTLSSEYSDVAREMNLEPELLLEAIHNYGSTDHHDRFRYIGGSIQRTVDSLVESTLSVWLKHESNLMLAREFVFAILVRGESFRDFNHIKDRYTQELNEAISEKYNKLYSNSINFKVTFDGSKLVFH